MSRGERRETLPGGGHFSFRSIAEGAMPIEIPAYYPFSPAARRAIVSAEALSERDLRDAIGHLRWQFGPIRGRMLSSDDCQTLKAATIQYATAMVVVFGQHVCEVARTSFPRVDQLSGSASTSWTPARRSPPRRTG